MVKTPPPLSRCNLSWRSLPGFQPAACELPAAGLVHLYLVPLQPTSQDLERFRPLLSADEKVRAARFHFDLHRQRFAAGRGSLRLILSSYTEVSPAHIAFQYGPNGKPGLAQPPDTNIQFNLAHSDDLALVAVTTGEPVGVDVELVRVLEDFDDLVLRFFSPAETAAFRNLPAEAKPKAFFSLWTRKEAMLKASGTGISHYLNQVEVTFLPDEQAKLVRLPRQFGQLNDWLLCDLPTSPGFAAAVAIQRRTNL